MSITPPVLLFLVQALVVVALPYALWRLPLVRTAVPLVVVQIALGVALGPTLLGRVAPELWQTLFPPAALVRLQGLVWLAVLLFAFLTGLHFDLTELRGHGRAFVLTSLGSVVAPTVLGIAAGLLLAEHLPASVGEAAQPLSFALGMGLAAGVTALPVLGAILRELDMLKEPSGRMALGCAAVNDAALWMMAAGLLALVAGSGAGRGVLMLAGIAVYGLVLWMAVRPLLRRLLASAVAQGRIAERDLVIVCSLLLLSCVVTQALGVDAIVGAFAFGAVLPRAVAEDLVRRLESLVVIVLLPFFFIVTGLSTRFDSASGVAGVFVVMTAVSVVGKMAGTVLPLRLTGAADLRTALVVGSFMQCKGMMELIVLTMLKDARIISDGCFSAMIAMALVTTAVTKPLVTWLRRGVPA